MEIVIIIFLGIFGAILGSFIGALTWRIHKNMDFVNDRSECEHCHHKLNGLDLVPVFSWLLLGGKCRYCKKPIGSTTLWLELGLAAVFIISYIFWPLGDIHNLNYIKPSQLVAFLLWLGSLVLLASHIDYDFRWGLLPNRFIWPLVLVAAALSITNNIFIHNIDLLNYIMSTVLALIPVAGIYYILYLISNGKWIGFGDVKFGIAVGFLLNWQGALMVLVFANILGSLVMIPMMGRKKMNFSSEIPFGPFLIVATFVVFIFYPQLIDISRNFLLLS